MNLYQYFLDNKSRPIHKCVHYFAVYERHFSPFVNLPIVLIEIGSGGGGSSQMWKKYFGPLAKIVTIDIAAECRAFEDDQVSVRIGDQSDHHFLKSVVDEFGPPDIVIDDGSHIMSHVNASFDFLFPRLSRTGIYLVEDLHTAYWPGYEGGLGRQASFIERSKRLIDQLNSDYICEPFECDPLCRNTTSLHFYDSVIVIEGGGYVSKKSVITGDTTMRIG